MKLTYTSEWIDRGADSCTLAIGIYHAYACRITGSTNWAYWVRLSLAYEEGDGPLEVARGEASDAFRARAAVEEAIREDHAESSQCFPIRTVRR